MAMVKAVGWGQEEEKKVAPRVSYGFAGLRGRGASAKP